MASDINDSSPFPADLVTATSLVRLFERLERRLEERLATEGAPEAVEEVLRHAYLALTSARREIEKPQGAVLGVSRLRSMMYWRERQRGVYESVDRVLLELVRDPAEPVAERAALRRDLGRLIDRLPPRCRGLLRLRYGLEVDSDQIAVKLGERTTGIRKATERCLVSLARVIVELGLERRDPA